MNATSAESVLPQLTPGDWPARLPKNSASQEPYYRFIEDVWPIYARQKAVRTAIGKINELKRSDPHGIPSTPILVIGEFESEAEFAARKARQSKSESKLHRYAVQRWQVEQEALARTIQDLEATETPATNIVATSLKQFEGTTPTKVEWTPSTRTLPFFDRESMSFESVDLTPESHEISYRENRQVLGNFYFGGVGLTRIRCGDLKVAQQLKNMFVRQEARISALVKPVILGWSDPIPFGSFDLASDRKRIHQLTNQLRSISLGESGEGTAVEWYVENRVAGRLSTAESREGVVFQFILLVMEMHIVDDEGIVVLWTEVLGDSLHSKHEIP